LADCTLAAGFVFDQAPAWRLGFENKLTFSNFRKPTAERLVGLFVRHLTSPANFESRQGTIRRERSIDEQRESK
jgi:hypothetical protein